MPGFGRNAPPKAPPRCHPSRPCDEAPLEHSEYNPETPFPARPTWSASIPTETPFASRPPDRPYPPRPPDRPYPPRPPDRPYPPSGPTLASEVAGVGVSGLVSWGIGLSAFAIGICCLYCCGRAMLIQMGRYCRRRWEASAAWWSQREALSRSYFSRNGPQDISIGDRVRRFFQRRAASSGAATARAFPPPSGVEQAGQPHEIPPSAPQQSSRPLPVSAASFPLPSGVELAGQPHEIPPSAPQQSSRPLPVSAASFPLPSGVELAGQPHEIPPSAPQQSSRPLPASTASGLIDEPEQPNRAEMRIVQNYFREIEESRRHLVSMQESASNDLAIAEAELERKRWEAEKVVADAKEAADIARRDAQRLVQDVEAKEAAVLSGAQEESNRLLDKAADVMRNAEIATRIAEHEADEVNAVLEAKRLELLNVKIEIDEGVEKVAELRGNVALMEKDKLEYEKVLIEARRRGDELKAEELKRQARIKQLEREAAAAAAALVINRKELTDLKAQVGKTRSGYHFKLRKSEDSLQALDSKIRAKESFVRALEEKVVTLEKDKAKFDQQRKRAERLRRSKTPPSRSPSFASARRAIPRTAMPRTSPHLASPTDETFHTPTAIAVTEQPTEAGGVSSPRRVKISFRDPREKRNPSPNSTANFCFNNFSQMHELAKTRASVIIPPVPLAAVEERSRFEEIKDDDSEKSLAVAKKGERAEPAITYSAYTTSLLNRQLQVFYEKEAANGEQAEGVADGVSEGEENQEVVARHEEATGQKEAASGEQAEVVADGVSEGKENQEVVARHEEAEGEKEAAGDGTVEGENNKGNEVRVTGESPVLFSHGQPGKKKKKKNSSRKSELESLANFGVKMRPGKKRTTKNSKSSKLCFESRQKSDESDSEE